MSVPVLFPMCSRFVPGALCTAPPRRCWVPPICSRCSRCFAGNGGAERFAAMSQAARWDIGITSAPLRSLSRWSAHAFIMVRRSVRYVAWL